MLVFHHAVIYNFRSDAAKSIKALYEMTGLESQPSLYKELRPQQILKSEENVRNVQNVIENEYLNPFGLIEDSEKQKLFNLSSGVPLPDEIADEILNTFRKGQSLYELFRKERILSCEKLFHATLQKNSFMSFAKISAKCTIKSKDGKTITAEVNRSILSALNSYSIKSTVALDFRKILEYPLCPVPLSICNGDGTRRRTSKSKLKEVLLADSESFDKAILNTFPKDVLLVDLIALISTMVYDLPATYEEFAQMLIQRIPKNYKRVDILTDDYKNKENSLKLNEQALRGQSERIQIASLQSRIPSEFRIRILRNNENKARLIELILAYIKEQKNECLRVLNSQEIVFSTEKKCFLFTLVEISAVSDLETSQEEADTKIILHTLYLRETLNLKVTVYSPSGDTDIIVLLLGCLQDHKEHILIIDGHGEDKKHLKLSDIDLEENLIDSLIGFHALTGNDYVSSFFRKGKKKCFGVLEKKVKFQEALTSLGTSWEVTPELFAEIQKYVCAIYGSTKKNINEVRYDIFYKKHQNQNKIVDMSTLPPCEQVLLLHVKRANYIASIWKKANVAKPVLPPIIDHGWNDDGSLTWVSDIYPEEVEEVLLDEEFDNNDYIEDSGESDDEEDV